MDVKRFRYKTDHQTHALLKLIANLEGMSMEEYAVRAIKEKAAADAEKYPFIAAEILDEGAAAVAK
jgi:hypothetical protein